MCRTLWVLVTQPLLERGPVARIGQNYYNIVFTDVAIKRELWRNGFRIKGPSGCCLTWGAGNWILQLLSFGCHLFQNIKADLTFHTSTVGQATDCIQGPCEEQGLLNLRPRWASRIGHRFNPFFFFFKPTRKLKSREIKRTAPKYHLIKWQSQNKNSDHLITVPWH